MIRFWGEQGFRAAGRNRLVQLKRGVGGGHGGGRSSSSRTTNRTRATRTHDDTIPLAETSVTGGCWHAAASGHLARQELTIDVHGGT